MNINLRKANAIQHSIMEAIKETEITTTVSISEHEEPEAVLERANKSLLENDRKQALLLTVMYNIRGLVAQANHESGISLILTKSALAEKRIQQLESLTRPSVKVVNLDVIKGRLEKIKTRKEDHYGRDTVDSGVVSEANFASFKKELLDLKKQKRKYADDVLELNVKTEIPLSEDAVKILTESGIL
jgi:hypothetical protein